MSESFIKIAAVQMRNSPGSKEENFQRAEELVAEAHRQQAQVILLPELFPGGYVASEAVWPLAENMDGPTSRWQIRLSQKLGITLGAGFPLWQGDDLFNVYQLCSCGKMVGLVKKNRTERDVFLPGKSENLVHTHSGRVGLGICADNHMITFLRKMKMLSPDWMAMPHAWPVPVRIGGLVSAQDMEKARADLIAFPGIYSRTLGVPVVFVNGVGPLLPLSGMLGRLMDPQYFELGGHSAIYDQNGACLSRLEGGEGIVAAELDLSCKEPGGPVPLEYEGWLHRGNPLMRRILMPVGNLISRWHYQQQRVQRAHYATEKGTDDLRGID